MTAMRAEPGEFVDRETIRFVRRSPHPVELVWEMLTEPKHLKAWFMTAQLDLRVGGRFAFGHAEDPHLAGVIIALEPPTVIEFANTTTLRAYGYVDATERLRFELASVGDGCLLVFTQHFPADTIGQSGDFEGSDVPAPGTPWRTGFLAGYHHFLERLGRYLDDRDIPLKAHDDRWHELDSLYRRHILDRFNC